MNVISRSIGPCVALAAVLAGAGAPILAAVGSYCENPHYVAPAKTIAAQLKPLADLLAGGEGDYNSVNRGWAGDTPGGMKSISGSSLTSYTVQQVMNLQKYRVYAVGRYQFIPSTLRFAVDASNVNRSDKFSPRVQDNLMAALVAYKRPSVLSYLQGSHNNLAFVLDELAREWASIAYRNGRSYYRSGGNRASISRAKVSKVLRKIKNNWNDAGLMP